MPAGAPSIAASAGAKTVNGPGRLSVGQFALEQVELRGFAEIHPEARRTGALPGRCLRTLNTRRRTMRRTLLLTAAFGAALLPCATAGLAQTQGTTPQAVSPQGTNLGTPLTQPQPGGSVAAGAGAPTSALPSAGGSAPVDAAAQGRGPPPPGSGTPVPQGSVTGSSQIGPTGAIVPGAQGGEPGTGGSQSSSTP